jgi:serine/threonine protein kinase
VTTPSPTLLQPGQTLADAYRIERFEGGGGMSEVYLARDTNLGLRVAIKVPKLAVLLTDQGGERFLREARLAARLRGGPHIVTIHCCLTDSRVKLGGWSPEDGRGVPFIVMEYLDGGNLAQRLAGGALEPTVAIALFEKICEAVNYAHTVTFDRDGLEHHGMVHRDIKPENVCFTSKGDVRVVDFGLARSLDASLSHTSVAGTPYYMAPEVWNPQFKLDHRLDIYALGVLLFQMVTAKLPFTGPHAEAIIAGHLFKPPPDPRSVRPDLPISLASAILRALEKDPDARFGSALEFATVVRRSIASTRRGDVIAHAIPTLANRIDVSRALQHLRRANSLAGEEKYDSAIVEYDMAVELNPFEANAFVNRGFCYYKKRLYSRAAAEYTHALDLDAQHPEAWNNRGMVWLELERYAEAASDFRHALQCDGAHPLAPNNLKRAESLLRQRA